MELPFGASMANERQQRPRVTRLLSEPHCMQIPNTPAAKRYVCESLLDTYDDNTLKQPSLT